MPHPAVAAIRLSFKDNACAADAAAVQRYMKSTQPFRGIKSPLRRKLITAALKQHPVKDADEYRDLVLALWKGKYRDEQYAALDVAERLRSYRTPDHWHLYERLLREAQWWDTVDWIAARLLGPLLLADRTKQAVVDEWVRDDSVWMRRASLLVHLKHKENTDTDALARSMDPLLREDSFWIRKAIGWVLRAYASTDPAWVQRYVADHPEMSPLSKREALRNIPAKT